MERFDAVLSRDDHAMVPEELQAALGDADAIICTGADRFGADVLATSPRRAKIICNYAVGTDNHDLAAAAAHGSSGRWSRCTSPSCSTGSA